ncbi:MAG: GNAT family N-acetyltransferase [Gammaproteobacteria bacterium]|nr:GNAT family N-acetyltransferase [Gammaproteobacteria bacterium]
MTDISWRWRHFDDLTRESLYAILQLRQEVFVVEQDCVYLDADGLDSAAYHLTGSVGDSEHSEVVAYTRVVPAGLKFAELSIGRVLTSQSVRGRGVGRNLMHETLRRIELFFPGADIRISAQHYLERFYTDLGFRTESAPYDEDGIPHIEMLRRNP